MTFTQAVRSVLSKYATFSGRASRSEYWWFYLFTILVNIGTSIIDAVLNTGFDNEIGIVSTVASLALLLPSIAVTARRLHDIGRTGWWMLFPVVTILATVVVAFVALFDALLGADADFRPAISWVLVLLVCGLLALAACITMLVFLCLDSTPGPNKYGPSPKQPPMVPPGQGGYYPNAGYGGPPPYPSDAQPYGYPQQPAAPPTPGSQPPHHQ